MARWWVDMLKRILLDLVLWRICSVRVFITMKSGCALLVCCCDAVDVHQTFILLWWRAEPATPEAQPQLVVQAQLYHHQSSISARRVSITEQVLKARNSEHELQGLQVSWTEWGWGYYLYFCALHKTENNGNYIWTLYYYDPNWSAGMPASYVVTH